MLIANAICDFVHCILIDSTDTWIHHTDNTMHSTDTSCMTTLQVMWELGNCSEKCEPSRRSAISKGHHCSIWTNNSTAHVEMIRGQSGIMSYKLMISN